MENQRTEMPGSQTCSCPTLPRGEEEKGGVLVDGGRGGGT